MRNRWYLVANQLRLGLHAKVLCKNPGVMIVIGPYWLSLRALEYGARDGRGGEIYQRVCSYCEVGLSAAAGISCGCDCFDFDAQPIMKELGDFNHGDGRGSRWRGCVEKAISCPSV